MTNMYHQTTASILHQPDTDTATATAEREFAGPPACDGVCGDDVPAAAALFALLGDQTRVRLLYLLTAGERNVTDLCVALAILQPTVSHHLGLMRRGGLLDCRRDGKRVFYSVGQGVTVNADGTLTLRARGFALVIGRTAAAVASDAPAPGLVLDAREHRRSYDDGQWVTANVRLAAATAR